MRVMYEPWFVKYKVDVVFAGHVHAYERSVSIPSMILCSEAMELRLNKLISSFMKSVHTFYDNFNCLNMHETWLRLNIEVCTTSVCDFSIFLSC